MDTNNKIPFPQADDFEKIVKIINIDDPTKYNDKMTMSRYLDDISLRQVQYYLSACMYLNLINSKKELTEEGKYIRHINNANQMVEFARIIVSNDIFGTVYFSEKYLKIKYSREDVEDLIRSSTSIDKESIIHRRSQTVLKWVEWITKNFDLSN